MRKPLEKIKSNKSSMELRRKLSLRKKVNGTEDRPRLCVNKTNKHLFVQVINDVTGKTLLTVKTYGKNTESLPANKEGAKKLGQDLAAKLGQMKIDRLVFDRNGKKYTGVIAAFAESVREQGIRI